MVRMLAFNEAILNHRPFPVYRETVEWTWSGYKHVQFPICRQFVQVGAMSKHYGVSESNPPKSLKADCCPCKARDFLTFAA
jgi:hypothetical protein